MHLIELIASLSSSQASFRPVTLPGFSLGHWCALWWLFCQILTLIIVDSTSVAILEDIFNKTLEALIWPLKKDEDRLKQKNINFI